MKRLLFNYQEFKQIFEGRNVTNTLQDWIEIFKKNDKLKDKKGDYYDYLFDKSGNPDNTGFGRLAQFDCKPRIINLEKSDYREEEFKKSKAIDPGDKIHSQAFIWYRCKEHGPFVTAINSHRSKGSGCPICRPHTVQTFGEIKQKWLQITGNENKYDYNQVKLWVDGVDPETQESITDDEKLPSSSYIWIKCEKEKHSFFKQLVATHSSGRGCPRCNPFKRAVKTFGEIKQKWLKIPGNENKYDYRQVKRFVEGKNPETQNSITDDEELPSSSYIWIKCKEHSFFKQLVNSHSSGRGCSKCSESKGEKVVSDLIMQYFNNVKEITPQFQIEGWNKRKQKVDFYIPDLKLWIEYDGEQHFRTVFFSSKKRNPEEKFKKVRAGDEWKNWLAEDKKIKLLRIKYKRILNEKTKGEIKNILYAVLDILTEKKEYSTIEGDPSRAKNIQDYWKSGIKDELLDSEEGEESSKLDKPTTLNPIQYWINFEIDADVNFQYKEQ